MGDMGGFTSFGPGGTKFKMSSNMGSNIDPN